MVKQKWTHLDHAPIVEALIDFRVSLQPGFEANTFRQAVELLNETYPVIEEIHTLELKSALNLNEATLNQEVADQIVGFRLRNTESTRLVQFRLDGFTFNHLKPYSDWDAFYDEAWHYWEMYIGIAKPSEVKRIALRYINKHEFPPNENIEEFIKHPPSFDKDAGDMAAFFFQAQIKSKESEDVNAIVVQFTEKLSERGGIPYVLDIDASRTGNFIVEDAEAFKNYFAQLRGFKNDIFFNTVTQKAIELWK